MKSLNPSGQLPDHACPRCREPGNPVPEVTLKALLRGPALEVRKSSKHRFCSTVKCPVVYFGTDESFTRDDLDIPVFQKEPPGNRIVCYCFEVRESEIVRERSRNGNSPLFAKVTQLVNADLCACELRNPQGNCCLGNMGRIVRSRLETPVGQTDTPAKISRAGGSK